MHDNEAKDILEDKFATLSRSLIWFENAVVLRSTGSNRGG
jgi:hypothetical protein